MFYTIVPTDDKYVFEYVESTTTTRTKPTLSLKTAIVFNRHSDRTSADCTPHVPTQCYWIIARLKPSGFSENRKTNFYTNIDKTVLPILNKNPWTACYRVISTTTNTITVEEWNLFKVKRWYIVPPRTIRFYIWIAITSPGIGFYFYNNNKTLNSHSQKPLNHQTTKKPPTQPKHKYGNTPPHTVRIENTSSALTKYANASKGVTIIAKQPHKLPKHTTNIQLKKKKYPQAEPLGRFFKDKLSDIYEESFRYTFYSVRKRLIADNQTGYAGKFSHLTSWNTKLASSGPKKRERNRKKVVTNNPLAYIWTERAISLDRVYITPASAKKYPASTAKILQTMEDRRIFLWSLIESLKPVPNPPTYYSMYPKEFFIKNPHITPPETLRMYKKTVNAMYSKTKREWRKELEKHHRKIVKIIKESRTDVVSKPPNLIPITPETKKKHGDYVPTSVNQILTLWIYKFNMHLRFWKLPKSTATDMNLYEYSPESLYWGLEETANWINERRLHKNHIDTHIDVNLLRWLRNAYPQDLTSIQEYIDSFDIFLVSGYTIE